MSAELGWRTRSSVYERGAQYGAWQTVPSNKGLTNGV